MQCLGRSEIFAMKNGMSPDRRQEAAQKPSVSHQVTHPMTAATAPSKRSSSKLSLTKDVGMVDMRGAGFSLKWPTVWWGFFFLLLMGDSLCLHIPDKKEGWLELLYLQRFKVFLTFLSHF